MILTEKKNYRYWIKIAKTKAQSGKTNKLNWKNLANNNEMP